MSERDSGNVTRRQVLATLAVAAAPSIPSMAQQRPRRWGVQLYTVRSHVASDAAATLNQLAAIGYTELEVLQPTLPVVAPLASSLGLTIVSSHLDGSTAKGEGLEAFLADAKRLGLQYVVVPFVPPAERPTDRAGFDAVAARL